MTLKNLFRLASGLVATVGLVGVAASPALAAVNTLPSGDSLYVIDADGTGIYETTNTGAETPLTLQFDNNINGFYPAGALSPLDDRAYLVFVTSETDNFCYLDSIDLLGGAPKPRLEMKAGTDNVFNCYGLNIDAEGKALLYGESVLDTTQGIWKLDLSTGALTDFVPVADQLYGFTVSPEGVWFGLKPDGSLVTIDKTNGTLSTVVTATLNDVYDCKFDRNGTLWFTNEEGSTPYQLYSWRSGDIAYTTQGDLSVDGNTAKGLYGPVFVGLSTQAIQDKSLPDTGLSGATVGSLSAVGIGAIAAGIVAIVVIRRRRA